MDCTVDRTVIDRNTVPNLRKSYKIRWCTVITVPYRITVNRTVHRRVTTLFILCVGQNHIHSRFRLCVGQNPIHSRFRLCVGQNHIHA